MKKGETSNRPQNRQLLIIVLLMASLIVSIGMFLWFRSANYRRIVRQNMNYITDSAIQEAEQIERDLQNAEALIINAANQYTTLSALKTDMSPLEVLETIHDNRIFSRIAFITPEGTDISWEGTAQVADRDYFKRAMQGETGWQFVEKSRVTNQPTLFFYTPVVQNGQITGVLVGTYDEKRIDDLFIRKLFNYTPHTYLFQSDGTIAASSQSALKEGNLLSGLEKETFQEEVSYQDVLDFIDDPSQKTLSFVFGESSISEGTIVKLARGGWMLLSILPSDVTANMVNSANRLGGLLEAILVIVFLLYIGIMFGSYRRQRLSLQKEVTNAKRDRNETLAEEKRHRSIIDCMVSIYSHAYFFNLQTMEYSIIRHKDDWVFAIPEKGNVKRAMEEYVDQLILPSFQEAMQEFVNVSTLERRLAETDTISVEYQRHDAKWCRGTFVVATRDDAGRARDVVYAVQLIDAEKKKDLDTQAALHDAYNAAQMASHAKTVFLSNMSHDMRTPMNAIIGMTAIAGAHLDDKERVAACLGKIASSSKHLLALINEVLDMSKIEAGKVDLNEEEFSLSELIDNMLTLNHSLLAAHQHDLTVDLHNVVDDQVIGDSVRLQQVFTNLLSNAAKYTPDRGKIKIDLTEKVMDNTDTAWFELTVQDNGIGMSEEFQKRLFEPFARADDEHVSKTQGTGLGMSISRNIIRMMNGDISVKSVLGEGSTFSVTFYLKLQSGAPPQPDFIGLPVLVADDEQSSCESACDILDSLGMNSEWVLSGEQAVEKVSVSHQTGKDYYAVILDWKMPGMGGLEAARAIREAVGEDMPIIILSAYDWSDVEQEAREAGVTAFLAKPLFKSRVSLVFNELMGKEPAKRKQTLQEVMEENDFTGKRVLLVEDNELNLEIAEEILEMTHLTVETATNGRIAVEKIAATQPNYYDLVLMDIQMPIMNGYEAAKAIRAMAREDARTLPIVAMTANTFASDVRAARAAGMNAHIAKPLDLEQLNRTLAKFLNAQSSKQE